MKPLILIFVLAFSIHCVPAQEQKISLEGTWSITECKYVFKEGTRKMMADEINEGTAVTDFYFWKDGKFKQISNMSGSGELETHEGSWKIAGDQLIVTLKINNQQTDINYTIEQTVDMLILKRPSPDGKMTIVNTFKKK